MEKYLNLDELYVLGTNCVDNGPREGLEKFMQAASETPGARRRMRNAGGSGTGAHGGRGTSAARACAAGGQGERRGVCGAVRRRRRCRCARRPSIAETALHYEFMQDFRVHIKHTDGHFEYVVR